jgi:lycopene cyclase domain-containing protein
MIQAIIYSHYLYLVILLIGIGGLVLADWQMKLVFFKNFSAAWKTIGILIVLMLAADIVGIKLGIFFTNQKYVTGLYIGTPNLPLEELFFLFLLSYVTLVLYQVLNRLPFIVALSEVEGSGQISRQARNDRKRTSAK